jgi:hypothetical protein
MKFFVAFTLLMGGVLAFGPATPVGGKWRRSIPSSSSSSSSSQGGGMTMRVGKTDLQRRQKINDLLDASASKEKVQANLLSDNTSDILKKCNWKMRNSLIRKVTAKANAFDVEVDPKFGLPPTPSERLHMEQSIKKTNMAKKEEQGMEWNGCLISCCVRTAATNRCLSLFFSSKQPPP